MPSIHIPRGWEIPEREATPEHLFLSRRKFLKAVGLASAGVVLLGCGQSREEKKTFAQELQQSESVSPTKDLYPAKRNTKYVLDRPLSDETVAGQYNNFYEFTEVKDRVHQLVGKFQTRPWQLEVTGLIKNSLKIDVDDLVRKIGLEERLYRHRCVEAWAMAVPWTGFSLSALIKLVEPMSSAKYVRFVAFNRPDQAPNQKEATYYPWPYFEGLTMAEAMNELTMLVTGVYGHELPKQHGAPIRLVTPWKYGFKSIKSIVKIEFTDAQPPTFWNTLVPNEYDFFANVNPKIPHLRWSQATERMIDTGERKPTQHYNGYGEFVAHLYQ
jgi:sulfoxide reductase catalytic subunit YedY